MSGHGGARPGADRKPTAEQFESEIATAKKCCADTLPDRLETVTGLAEGGYEKQMRKMLPAALVMKKKIVHDNGVPHNVEEPAFPDEKADKMMCVEETRQRLAPDRAANIYLVDRILGKPTATVEAEITADMGGALIEAFGGALEKIYGGTSGGGTPYGGTSGGDSAAAAGG